MKQIKLYKEGSNQWAARMHLNERTDMDIVVQVGPCGRAMTTINVCLPDYEGVVPVNHLDWQEVNQFQKGKFVGSDRLDHGTAKLFSFTGKPDHIEVANTTINLLYEA